MGAHGASGEVVNELITKSMYLLVTIQTGNGANRIGNVRGTSGGVTVLSSCTQQRAGKNQDSF